jgi:hypothetical protein
LLKESDGKRAIASAGIIHRTSPDKDPTMAGCDPQTFTGFTQAQFDCLVQKAATAGIAISGNSGSGEQRGIAMSWSYDPATQTLTLHCTDKPIFLTCGMINGQVQNLVSSCR